MTRWIKTRKYWITITKDEEFETRFHISLLPFRYRKAPATMMKLAFVSQRSFDSERDAITAARSLFGNIMNFQRKGDQWCAAFNLDASDLSN